MKRKIFTFVSTLALSAALIISALITFLPVALITLGVLALVGYLFVMR